MTTYVAESDSGANLLEKPLEIDLGKVEQNATQPYVLSGNQIGHKWCCTIYSQKSTAAYVPPYDSATMDFMEYVLHIGVKSAKEHYHVYIKYKEKVDMAFVKKSLNADHAHCELLRSRSEYSYLYYIENSLTKILGPVCHGSLSKPKLKFDCSNLVPSDVFYRDSKMMHPNVIRNTKGEKKMISHILPKVFDVIKQDSDLLAWQTKAMQMLMTSQKRIIWAYSERRRVGRTEFAMYLYSAKGACLLYPGDINFSKKIYDGQPLVIYDLHYKYDTNDDEFLVQLSDDMETLAIKYNDETKDIKACIYSILVLAHCAPPECVSCMILNIDAEKD